MRGVHHQALSERFGTAAIRRFERQAQNATSTSLLVFKMSGSKVLSQSLFSELAMSDSPAAPPSGQAAAAEHASLASTLRETSSSTFLYHDHFLGRDVRYPVAQQQQSDAPLKLIKPATWFLLRQVCAAPGANDLQHRLPICYIQVAIWPAQRVRDMFSCSAMICHRLSAQAASVNVGRRKGAWSALIHSRVLAGYVSRVRCAFACPRAAICVWPLLPAHV